MAGSAACRPVIMPLACFHVPVHACQTGRLTRIYSRLRRYGCSGACMFADPTRLRYISGDVTPLPRGSPHSAAACLRVTLNTTCQAGLQRHPFPIVDRTHPAHSPGELPYGPPAAFISNAWYDDRLAALTACLTD